MYRAFRPQMIIVAGLVIAACGGGTTATRPTETDETDSKSPLAAMYEVGETVTIDRFSIRIDDLSVDSDASGPWIVVETSMENRSDREANIPYLEVHCAGGEEGGGWLVSSTLALGAELPAKSADSGAVHLLLPNDDRVDGTRSPCRTPAVIRVVGLGVSYAIPDTVIVEANEASPTTGDSVGDQPDDTPAASPDSTSTTTPAGNQSDELLDMLAALDEAGVSCVDAVPVAPDPSTTDFGLAEPEASFECTSPDIGTVAITRWADGATMRSTMRVAVELSDAFGQDIRQFRVIVVDERTLLGSESDETSQSEAVLDWLERAQDVVGGDIRTISDIIGG